MIIDSIFQKLENWAGDNAHVMGLVAYGSQVDNTANQYSDVNVVVIVESVDAIESVSSSLEKVLDGTGYFSIIIKDEYQNPKQVVYIENEQRIECTYVQDIQKMAPFWIHQGSISILKDKTGTIQEFISRLPSSSVLLPSSKIAEIIREHVSMILYKFERISSSFLADDYMRFYKDYIEIINNAIQVLAMLENEHGLMHRPKLALFKIMGEIERSYFEDNLLKIELERINTLREHFLDWFYDLLERVEERYPEALPRPIDKIEKFCNDVFKKYFIWNFRKVYGTNSIFRSMVPQMHEKKPQYLEWLKRNDIRTFIDLRRQREIDLRPTDPKFAEKAGLEIKYMSLNFPPGVENTVDAPAYVRILVYEPLKEIIAKIFRVFKDAPGGILFHCNAGRDRTGVIAALVQLLMGVPEARIENDYIIAHDTNPVHIKNVLKYIKDFGGIEEFLVSCGFSLDEQSALYAKIKA
ncbi:MAG: tyrosine-protein phosphatase [Candidatus Hodarchaeota archaeon]